MSIRVAGTKGRHRLLIAAVIGAMVLFGAVASASTILPPLASVHPAAMPASSLTRQDSCSMIQYDSLRLPGIYNVDLRGFAVKLLGPLGWACNIDDGDGSGASITFERTSALPYSDRGSITLDASANTNDNGANFCPYSTKLPPPPASGGCYGRTARPKGEEVKYLYGSSTTASMVILIADPTGAKTPFTGIATEPTMTVLAASTRGAAYDLVCSVGTTLSSICMTDAARFTVAYRHLG